MNSKTMNSRLKLNEDTYKRELLLEKIEINFNSFVFTSAMRISASLLGTDLVSVQPLPLPSGLLFYFDHERKDLYKRILLVEKYKTKKTRRSRRGGRGGRMLPWNVVGGRRKWSETI